MTQQEAPIRVLVVDDHELVRRGLRQLLDAAEDLQVCGEAGTATDALTLAEELRPDVLVLDVRLPDGDGVSVCRAVRTHVPEAACLMLTSYPDDEALVAAVAAGAAGYLLKQVRGLDLVDAVRTVAHGGSVLSPRDTSLVLSRLQGSGAGPLQALTDKERRVLELIGDGLSNREIGQRMGLAEKTVKNHVSSVLRKLRLQRRTQAAVLVERLRQDSAAGGSSEMHAPALSC